MLLKVIDQLYFGLNDNFTGVKVSIFKLIGYILLVTACAVPPNIINGDDHELFPAFPALCLRRFRTSFR